MGYFSNGTEGCSYAEQYCDRCIHQGSDDGPGCPVWLLHLEWNYDACNGGEPNATADEKLKHKALTLLIPLDEKGCNQQCTMFVENKT